MCVLLYVFPYGLDCIACLVVRFCVCLFVADFVIGVVWDLVLLCISMCCCVFGIQVLVLRFWFGVFCVLGLPVLFCDAYT